MMKMDFQFFPLWNNLLFNNEYIFLFKWGLIFRFLTHQWRFQRGAGGAPPPYGPKFSYFHAVFLGKSGKCICWPPSYEDSWIRPCIWIKPALIQLFSYSSFDLYSVTMSDILRYFYSLVLRVLYWNTLSRSVFICKMIAFHSVDLRMTFFSENWAQNIPGGRKG